ncbi:MAG TPA: hypothetical protein VGP72_06460 [Planctomycetota bacterium]|jgi:hypothetical protein
MKNSRQNAKASKSAAKRAKVVATPKVSLDQIAKKAESKEKATEPKNHPARSGDLITINEAVGVHFRAEAKGAPTAGDIICVKIGDNEIPLICSFTTPLKEGSILVQAFVTAGSGDYKVLGAAKGQKAQVLWAD